MRLVLLEPVPQVALGLRLCGVGAHQISAVVPEEVLLPSCDDERKVPELVDGGGAPRAALGKLPCAVVPSVRDDETEDHFAVGTPVGIPLLEGLSLHVLFFVIHLTLQVVQEAQYRALGTLQHRRAPQGTPDNE
jgi:hypothetical protein